MGFCCGKFQLSSVIDYVILGITLQWLHSFSYVKSVISPNSWYPDLLADHIGESGFVIATHELRP